MLNKIGLSESDQRRWEVRRVVCASGKLHGFRLGQYYASHRSVGGRKTFWKVDFHTLEASVWSVLDLAGSLVTSDIEVTPNRQGTSEVELLFGTWKKAQALE